MDALRIYLKEEEEVVVSPIRLVAPKTAMWLDRKPTCSHVQRSVHTWHGR